MRLHCRYCDEETAHYEQREPVNHILHLLLSLFTGGLWVIVWILVVAMAKNRKICSKCERER